MITDTNDEQCWEEAILFSGYATTLRFGWRPCILPWSNGMSLAPITLRHLTPPPQIGLIGVFPYVLINNTSAKDPSSSTNLLLRSRYSAIDMSTFEALKIAYLKSTGKEEPGVMALLAFGSVSGSVGATSVYPLNLVRTRLQASGSPGHPQKYTGVWDVAVRTWERDGWRGFYRGLLPTLAKVKSFRSL